MSLVTIHMVSSLDGFIAKPDGDVSWMHASTTYEKGVLLSEEAIADFVKSIDCYVMGSRTYEHALELGWPYGDTPVVVMTRRNLRSDRANVRFQDGPLHEIVADLKARFRNIWLVGGAALTRAFIQAGLADEIVISIIPVLLGQGTRFFDDIGEELPLQLEDVTAYRDGTVELIYEVLKRDDDKTSHPENATG